MSSTYILLSRTCLTPYIYFMTFVHLRLSYPPRDMHIVTRAAFSRAIAFNGSDRPVPFIVVRLNLYCLTDSNVAPKYIKCISGIWLFDLVIFTLSDTGTSLTAFLELNRKQARGYVLNVF